LSIEEKHYARNPDYVFRRIVDEMILVPIHQDMADLDCIYSLNSLGAFIWEQLENPETKGKLKSAIQVEFEAEIDIIRQDLETFLQEMVSIGAIKEI